METRNKSRDRFCACHKEFLHDHGIVLKEDQIAEYPTTKSKVLVNEDDSRDLFLLSKCIPLTDDDIEEIDADCWLVTPVIDEVPVNVLKAIVKDGGKKGFRDA